jgi:hypothetical protein
LVSAVVSQVTGTEVFVTIPGYSQEHKHGPMEYAGLPSVGDEVVVAYDHKGAGHIVWTALPKTPASYKTVKLSPEEMEAGYVFSATRNCVVQWQGPGKREIGGLNLGNSEQFVVPAGATFKNAGAGYPATFYYLPLTA